MWFILEGVPGTRRWGQERKFHQPRVLFNLIITVGKCCLPHSDEGRGEILSNECCGPPWTRVAPRMSNPGTEIRRL